MIKSFADRATRALFERDPPRRLPADVTRRALRTLRQIDSAVSLEDLRVPPGNRLELLYGDRRGQHSVRVNDQWRICFRWDQNHAYDVELVDYH